MWLEKIKKARELRPGKNEIFLIYRINERDDLFDTVFSSYYSDEEPSTGIRTYELKAGAKLKSTDNALELSPPLNIPCTNPQDYKLIASVFKARQGGGHAEEAFIRLLPSLLLQAQQFKKIELLVSRIPCADGSAAWACLEPLGNSLDKMCVPRPVLPEGCGPKLHEIIEGFPDTQWSIRWLEGYPNSMTQQACEREMSKIADLKNVREVGPLAF